jgi:DNA-binding FadR family transcriptional regulator
VTSKTSVAIGGLKALLLSGEVRPGERLPPEADLRARLGVSRNVLREAVRALVHAGVLRTRQGDGTYVGTMEPGELLDSVAMYTSLATGARIEQVLEARRIIEPELTAMAASKMSDAELGRLDELLADIERATPGNYPIDSDIGFHRVIAEASGNLLLAGLLDAFTPITLRPRQWRAVIDAGSLESQVHQHRSIAEAIRARDPDAARAAALLHVSDVMRFFRAHSTTPAAFDELNGVPADVDEGHGHR